MEVSFSVGRKISAVAPVVAVLFLSLADVSGAAAPPPKGQGFFDPRVAELVEKGRRLLASQQFDQAIAEFQAALSIDPSLADVHNSLAMLTFKRVIRFERRANFRKPYVLTRKMRKRDPT